MWTTLRDKGSTQKETIILFLFLGENMPIYTTYLGKKPKTLAQKLGSCFIYYVMRNRGNNEVSPTKETLFVVKEMVKRGEPRAWEIYKSNYFYCLTEKSVAWMEQRAWEAKIGNVLLVCYEKDSTHCHRRLLAEEISRRFSVEYKGELT